MKSTVHQMDPIFKPKSVAIIGASATPGKWGYMTLYRPIKSGFGGAIYPVNPGLSEVLGLRCYRSILDIPDEVDLAVLTTPAAQTPHLMTECVQKGTKGAILIAGGFAEVGAEGKRLEQEVVSIARRGGVRFVGPNTMGIWNAARNLNLCPHLNFRPGPIAFVSQSGTFGGYMAELASATGHGLSKFISIGNQADLTASDYLEYIATDEDTKIVVFYIEGFKDGRRFFNLARETIKTKPIVIFKGGSTGAGARATMSHTASLAGSREVFEGMCRQAGLIRAQDAMQCFRIAEALIGQPLPPGRRIAIMGSGGQGVVTADACESLGLEVPELDSKAASAIKKLLPPHAPPPRNPVDFAGSFRTASQEAPVVEQLLRLDYIDGVITNVPLSPSTWLQATRDDQHSSHSETDMDSKALEGIKYLASLPGKYVKPVVCLRLRRLQDDSYINIMRQAGIPIYNTPDECARAMRALVEYAEFRNRARKV